MWWCQLNTATGKNETINIILSNSLNSYNQGTDQKSSKVVARVSSLFREGVQFTVSARFEVTHDSSTSNCIDAGNGQLLCCSKKVLGNKKRIQLSSNQAVGITSISSRLLAISSSILVAPVQHYEIDNTNTLSVGRTITLTDRDVMNSSFIPLFRYFIGKFCIYTVHVLNVCYCTDTSISSKGPDKKAKATAPGTNMETTESVTNQAIIQGKCLIIMTHLFR